jgi:predicted ATPase
LDGVHSLVSKCLVSADLSGRDPRYRLLDITRSYLATKLLEEAECDVIARRHAGFYLSHLERSGLGGDPKKGHEHLGNIRAALEWSFGKSGDPETGAAIAAAAAPLLMELSLLVECRRWTSTGIAALNTSGTRAEIELQAALGHCLMFTEGNSKRAEQAFARGLELAKELDEPLLQLRLLGGLHIFHERTSDYRKAISFAQRSSVVAQELGDPAGVAAAESLLGIAQHLVGDQERSRSHLQTALSLTPESSQITATHFGFHYRNRASIAMARILWIEGHPEQAAKLAEATINEATALEHPVTIGIALIWGISVSLWIGDLAAADRMIATFAAHANKHSLAPYDAVANGLLGSLLVQRGEAETGIRLLENALRVLHAANYELLTTSFNLAMAGGLSAQGRHTHALNVIESCVSQIQENGNLLYMPEALRLKGELLYSDPGSSNALAQEILKESLRWARDQQAPAWQLRSATSLAKVLFREERESEGREMIEPIISRFTEGFAFPDLQVAAGLLHSN